MLKLKDLSMSGSYVIIIAVYRKFTEEFNRVKGV